MKLLKDTANGVLCLIRCKGMTGYGAQRVSTSMNSAPETPLVTNSPHIQGFDQDNSSVVLRLKPRRRHPTAPTRVNEPKKSMRRSLSYRLWFCTSNGSSIFTFKATKVNEKIKMGVWWLNKISTYNFYCQLKWLACRRNAARLMINVS